MTKELNLSEIFSNLVRFISRNIRLLLVFMVIGVISVIGYQKLKTPYYETKAICTSGISEYERQEQAEDLSQRTAIDLINHLQINIDNKDYSALALSLGLDIEIASTIKKIEAEQLYQQDMDENFYALNKFEVLLITYDNQMNKKIESALQYYFESNKYILDYYTLYVESCSALINDINDEIEFINQIRAETSMKSLVLGSTNTISGDDRRLSNEIIALSHMREEIRTNSKLLKPLSFVKGFANVDQNEDDILVLSILGAILSFILGVFVAFVKETNIN